MGKVIPIHIRQAIGAEIEEHLSRVDVLLARLDAMDGDPDLEDDDPDTSIEDQPHDAEEDRDESGDDGCGAFVLHGVIHWGAQADQMGVLMPVYGVDQTKGPVNTGFAQ